MRYRFTTLLLPLVAIGFFVAPRATHASDHRDIIFPVIGTVHYTDDFGAPRVGHTHEGNDLIGTKMQKLVAAVDGVVRFVPYPEPSYGWYVSIEDADGYRYNYLHINNDTPGTDDGKGSPNVAYAPGIKAGWPVVKGQLIGYMGDSGNAETTVPHLHFEIRRPDDTAVDPFGSLRTAKHIGAPVRPPLRQGEMQPYGLFSGGGNIASGDIDPRYSGDELVFGAGSGGGPNVQVYTYDGAQLAGWLVPISNFKGGVDVAVGDVNGDGTNDIIVGLGPGGPPRVYIFSEQGLLLAQFDAYDSRFRGGIHVAAADLDGDGKAEIITGPGPTGGPEVRTFDFTGNMLHAFFAYDPRFRGGVDVAGVSQTDTVAGRIVTSPGPSGGPDVRAFSPTGTLQLSYYAFDKSFHGGVRVGIWNNALDGQPVIVSIPWSGARSFIHLHDLSGNQLDERLGFENWWFGGFDVTVANDQLYAITGKGRTTSVQLVGF